jgi:hypothetical protein
MKDSANVDPDYIFSLRIEIILGFTRKEDIFWKFKIEAATI